MNKASICRFCVLYQKICKTWYRLIYCDFLSLGIGVKIVRYLKREQDFIKAYLSKYGARQFAATRMSYSKQNDFSQKKSRRNLQITAQIKEIIE